MFTINIMLEKKYNDLYKLCNTNVIRQVQISKGLSDIEDADMLNTLCIRWLRKYKNVEFEDNKFDEIFEKLKTEFLGEKNNYSKMYKPDTMVFIPLKLKEYD